MYFFIPIFKSKIFSKFLFLKIQPIKSPFKKICRLVHPFQNFFQHLQKNPRKKHKYFPYKGQATLENILLWAVIGVVAFVVNNHLGKYLKDISGAMIGPNGYYGCLTKAGKLPGDPEARINMQDPGSPTCKHTFKHSSSLCYQ